MMIRPFNAVFPKIVSIDDFSAFVGSVRELYPAYQEQGNFLPEEEKAMYVYQIMKGSEQYTGLIGAVSVADYISERIMRHEHTMVKKEVKQAQLFKEREAAVKPVLLAHRHHQDLSGILLNYVDKTSPVHTFTIGDELHRFWKIDTETDIEKIQYCFAEQIDTTYIADGHHRFSGIARLYEEHKELRKDTENPYAYLMCALFPSSALQVHNFNRSLHIFDEQFSSLKLLALLSQYADLRPLDEAQAPACEHEITFCIGSEWFAMNWRADVLSNNISLGLPTLDVSMLNFYVLRDICGVTDIRNDLRIKYIEGPKGLKALAKASAKKQVVSFCLHPIGWESFFRVIDHGMVLPPKSTWFEPRMKNGLIVQPTPL